MKHPIPTAHTLCATPLGNLLLAATPHGLCGAWFTEGQQGTPAWSEWGAPQPGHPVLAEATRQLGAYFARPHRRLDVPLDLTRGTPFQQTVWRSLLDIDVGQSQSYRQVAERIGRPAAVRAVGTAVGANPLSLFVPCHRVLGSSGALTGYAGGLARKAALLKLEGWAVDTPAHDGEPRATLRPRQVTAA